MSEALTIITGATRGIGRAIAERFAQAGHDLAICARTPEPLQQEQERLQRQYGVRVAACVADLSQRTSASEFVDFVKRQQRPLGVLVNNAGKFAQGPLHSEPKGLMERLMAANFYSAYWVTKGLSGLFMQQKQGHIINICSIGSITHKPGGGSYFVSKQALYGFTKNLQEDMRPHGIKVTAVLPSATYTSSWDGSGVDPERLMAASDVAEAVWAATAFSPRTQLEDIVLRPPLGDL